MLIVFNIYNIQYKCSVDTWKAAQWLLVQFYMQRIWSNRDEIINWRMYMLHSDVFQKEEEIYWLTELFT
jgi:hypothetical protein